MLWIRHRGTRRLAGRPSLGWRLPGHGYRDPGLAPRRPLAISGEIEWTQDGHLFTIQSMTYAYATLGTRDLVAIANSLR
jgi:hypothetical protein